MALIKCPECGQEISDQSKKCVHCGFKLKKGPKKMPKAVAIIGYILLILDVASFVLFEFGPEDITDCWYCDADFHIAMFAVLYVSLILIFIYSAINKKIKVFVLTLVILLPIMAGLAIGGKIKCENELYEEYESHENTADRFLIYKTPDYPDKTERYWKCTEFLEDHKVAITRFGYSRSELDGKIYGAFSQTKYYTYSFKTNLFGMYGRYIDDGTVIYLTDEDGNSFNYSSWEICSFEGEWSTENLRGYDLD